ncbi:MULTISPECIES: alpha/beta hydrolase [Nocardioides]|uniref:Alpha/beta hydrolase n=1 Tax=Nocardioides vastitatis TaxID=2568655 RepID=A0ABW0ZH74_9ACTN|nr:alpha/beta hydrolase [Nocardioides sp.]THJ05332.1 alpha/beta hydrolase [Nocardioides sp.]
MRPHHLLDPDLLAFVEALPPSDMDEPALAETRALLGRLIASIPLEHPGCEVTRTRAASRHEEYDVPLVVVRPRPVRDDGVPGTAVVWMHGGGYLAGQAEQDVPLLADLAAELGVVGVSVDYRLAPEHPHPAPVEDAYAGLAWVHEHAEELGIDRDRVIVAGESAGGGLAAALSTLARDRAELPIAKQLLVYPMLDDRTARPDAELSPFAGQLLWTPASNRFGWRSLLGEEPGAPGISPYASPARAEDLHGLPPTYLEVGELDLFVDEDVAYGHRLIKAGVPTELHVIAGAVHGYNHAGDLPICRDHRARIHRAIETVGGG